MSLAVLCMSEADGGNGSEFSAIVPGSLALTSGKSALRLDGLQKVRGVNALKRDAAIEFGQANISVIYGPSGSGKSSFARVLKNACGSRARDDIYPDAFVKDVEPAVGEISVTKDGVMHALGWSLELGPLSALRDVHVFDSKSAGMYLNLKNEATYEPRRMRFLSLLVSICDGVTAELEGRKRSLVQRLPVMPQELAGTPAASWLGTIKGSTTALEVDARCDYSEVLNAERVAAESALSQKDIPSRLKAIATEIKATSTLKTSLSALKAGLSDVALDRLIRARAAAREARRVATNDANAVFANAPLSGVGSQTWMKLWEQARLYSEQHAYSGQPYPVTAQGSRCVLCQSALEEADTIRMTRFEAFVRGGLEAAAKAAEQELTTHTAALPTLPSTSEWTVQASLLKIGDEAAIASRRDLESRRLAADTVLQLSELPAFNWSAIDAAVAVMEGALATEQAMFLGLQQDGQRKTLEARLVELRSLEWLSQNKAAIVEEVKRLSALTLLDKAVAFARTNAITGKKNELAKEELDAGYRTRFASELKSMGGARIPVFPESKNEGKAKISFGLSLKGAKRPIDSNRVLSEGEARVVALAAFLADISGSGMLTPFVFDDPISSLDQTFEELVASRLVELSKVRQVIVFTHRLSLLTLIEECVERISSKAKLEQVDSPVSLRVIALSRLDGSAGNVHEINLRDDSPKSAVKRLRDEIVPKLRKLQEAGDVSAYTIQLLAVCTEFRILLERCVERILLGGVIKRFRRSIQTKGKLAPLAKISADDCAFIDDLMTRFSDFEHSQSDELPSQPPSLEEFTADVQALAKWIEEFEKRAAK